jgi:hypothetical protein
VIEPHLRTFARAEAHVFAGTAQPLWRRSTIRRCGEQERPTAVSLDAGARLVRRGCLLSPARPPAAGLKGVPTVMINLIACSICLRVRRGSEWLDAEHVIRDIRSYDNELPRLKGAVCDGCAEAISRRRAVAENAVAA